MGSRGCYENCAYCCIATLHHLAPGKRFRQRKAELIADEMAKLYRGREIKGNPPVCALSGSHTVTFVLFKPRDILLIGV
jgi:biotin synthase-like enzyme